MVRICKNINFFTFTLYYFLLEPSSKEVDSCKACICCEQFISRLRLYEHIRKCIKRHEAGTSLENSTHSDQENPSQNNESTSTSQAEVAAYETANQVLERSLMDQAMNPPFTQESVLTMETP
jgi:hypothetical protein